MEEYQRYLVLFTFLIDVFFLNYSINIYLLHSCSLVPQYYLWISCQNRFEEYILHPYTQTDCSFRILLHMVYILKFH